MRVLVTGGCGFLGSHVCEHFNELGWEVVSLDNMTKFELARTGYQAEATRDHNADILGGLGVRLVQEDVRNAEAVADLAADCDYIVHTAAQPAVTISLEEPQLDLATNVGGTVNVLEAARRHGIPVASCATVHVYGNWINDELSESGDRYVREPAEVPESATTMEGYLTPLHASKAAGELYVRTWISSYGVRAASFRLTGLYGPRQFGGEDHGWVANFSIRNLLDWPITIFGSGRQVRDILYASDAVRAFQAFFERGEAGVYNVGGGQRHSISLLESLARIEAVSGRKNQVRFEDARFGDLKYFVCDIGRAKSMMGWEPQVAPDEGIEKLVAWLEENRALFTTKDGA